MTRLISDWKEAATRYYSTWALYLLLGLPEIIPALMSTFGLTMDSPNTIVRIMQVITAAGLIGRFIDQKKPDKAGS